MGRGGGRGFLVAWRSLKVLQGFAGRRPNRLGGPRNLEGVGLGLEFLHGFATAGLSGWVEVSRRSLLVPGVSAVLLKAKCTALLSWSPVLEEGVHKGGMVDLPLGWLVVQLLLLLRWFLMTFGCLIQRHVRRTSPAPFRIC